MEIDLLELEEYENRLAIKRSALKQNDTNTQREEGEPNVDQLVDDLDELLNLNSSRQDDELNNRDDNACDNKNNELVNKSCLAVADDDIRSTTITTTANSNVTTTATTTTTPTSLPLLIYNFMAVLIFLNHILYKTKS